MEQIPNYLVVLFIAAIIGFIILAAAVAFLIARFRKNIRENRLVMQNDINEHLDAIRCALIRNEELQNTGIGHLNNTAHQHHQQVIEAINQAKAKRDGNGRFVAKKDN